MCRAHIPLGFLNQWVMMVHASSTVLSYALSSEGSPFLWSACTVSLKLGNACCRRGACITLVMCIFASNGCVALPYCDSSIRKACV